MKKYPDTDNNLPPKISIQRFNDFIKEACEKAELAETGRLSSNPTAPLHSLITSHTGRRTFCTLMHNGGLDDRTIMSVSGHRSPKSFEKYLKVSKENSAKKIQMFQDENASKYLLSVAK